MRLTFCHHLMRDCDCLDDEEAEISFIGVHSMYYLTEADYRQMGRYCNASGFTTFTAAVHVPSLGTQLPKSKPEFMFVSSQMLPELFTVRQRVYDYFLRKCFSDVLLAFIPLGPAGTIYAHPSMSWLQAGGFHSSIITRWLQTALEGGWWTSATIAAIVAIVGAAFWAGQEVVSRHHLSAVAWYCTWLVDCPVPWYYRLAGVGLTLLSLLSGSIAMFLVVRFCTLRTAEPGWLTDTTVSVSHSTTIPDPHGDPIAEILTLRVGRPRMLEMLTFATGIVEPQVFSHALQMFANGGVPDLVCGRAFSAGMRRYKTTPDVTANSVRQARLKFDSLNLLTPGDQTSMNGSSERRCSLGFIMKMRSAWAYLTQCLFTLVLVLSFLVLPIACVILAVKGGRGWLA